MTIKLLEKLKNKVRRDLFVAGQIKTGLPFQIRALRDKKGWTQAQLGEKLGMTQTNVSRLESPNYARLNLTTLQRIASVFDVALIVRFVPFSELIKWTDTLTPSAMAPASFEEEDLESNLAGQPARTVFTNVWTSRIAANELFERTQYVWTPPSDIGVPIGMTSSDQLSSWRFYLSHSDEDHLSAFQPTIDSTVETEAIEIPPAFMIGGGNTATFDYEESDYSH